MNTQHCTRPEAGTEHTRRRLLAGVCYSRGCAATATKVSHSCALLLPVLEFQGHALAAMNAPCGRCFPGPNRGDSLQRLPKRPAVRYRLYPGLTQPTTAQPLHPCSCLKQSRRRRDDPASPRRLLGEVSVVDGVQVVDRVPLLRAWPWRCGWLPSIHFVRVSFWQRPCYVDLPQRGDIDVPEP